MYIGYEPDASKQTVPKLNNMYSYGMPIVCKAFNKNISNIFSKYFHEKDIVSIIFTYFFLRDKNVCYEKSRNGITEL